MTTQTQRVRPEWQTVHIAQLARLHPEWRAVTGQELRPPVAQVDVAHAGAVAWQDKQKALAWCSKVLVAHSYPGHDTLSVCACVRARGG